MQLSINQLSLDGGTQPRAQLDMLVIGEYAEAMCRGDEFPPVTVFFDGQSYWLADGFHRVRAAEQNGDELAAVEADVRQGTKRDAVLYSCSANAGHGLRRTNDDKRRAVFKLLDDPEWATWSDGEIARRCAVSPGLVGSLRPQPQPHPAPPAPSIQDAEMARRGVSAETLSVAGRDLAGARQVERAATRERTVKRGGKTYTMKTARIGRDKPARKTVTATVAKSLEKAKIAAQPVPTGTSAKCPGCRELPAAYKKREDGGYECGDCGARVSLGVAPYTASAKLKTCRKCGKVVSGKICANCGVVSR